MAPNLLHLPNGQVVTVSPVFGGLFFKSNELNTHNGAFPPGWTIVLQSEDDEEDHATPGEDTLDPEATARNHHLHRYRRPTLKNDRLFISSISNPSNSDFKPATSPSRQIAMMLWATLCWYFHQPPPDPHISFGVNPNTPRTGRPKGEWRINVIREGIFKGRHIMSKLERMGLISSQESCAGIDVDERTGEAWTGMFVSQRAFWQLDPRIFLFTLAPTTGSPFPPGSPYPSRPSSPSREGGMSSPRIESHNDIATQGLWSPALAGPFFSASHLPTYYPPPPTQYVMTNNVRHPLRPKPPRPGETFYTRFIPSFGQYLSFRTASISTKAPTHYGPTSSPTPSFLPPNSSVITPSAFGNMSIRPSDTELLHSWMNDARVAAAWGVSGPIETQVAFLKANLLNKHSFPVIGCWDGKPFGYFEIYWVKEDQLGKYIDGRELGDWDRGIHVLVGEQEFRGPERVKVWLSALVHYCWLAEQRTEKVMLEPRIDNEKFIGYLQDAGFYKVKEVAFSYKQSALMQINREAWDTPAL